MKFTIGFIVGAMTCYVIHVLGGDAWQAITRWNKKRKQRRYERNQRHKGLAVRKHW